MRIGAQHEKLCSKIKTLDGRALGSSGSMKSVICVYTSRVPWNLNVPFYRAANSIFAKVGRPASEEVIYSAVVKAKMFACVVVCIRSV